MSQQAFGSGIMWATPQSDASGAAIAVPPSLLFGIMQDVSVDISGDIKELFGMNTYPYVTAKGKSKIAIKAKTAQIYAALFNGVFHGQTLAAGIYAMNYDTAGAPIPSPSGPYTITPAVPNSGTWDHDLGVIGTTGLPYKKVAPGTPTAGQYCVTAGVYTFAAADAAKTVFINYAYTATSTVAQSETVMNQPMGYAPTFQLDLFMPFQGKSKCLTFFACISTKLAMATKIDDFMIPELDMSAFADPAGRVFKWSTSE